METLAHTPRGVAGQPTQPTWIGINHIALVTPDLDATVRFYGQLLGLQLIAAMARRSARLGRHVMFDAGGGVLHFFESPEARIFAPPVGHTWTPLTLPGALQHVALQVPSKDALLTLHSTLEQAGVTVGAIGAIGPLENFLFVDPHGIMLEAVWAPMALDALPDDVRFSDPDPSPAIVDVCTAQGDTSRTATEE